MSGTCSICKLPVADGAEIHGLRGDHWACVYPSGYKTVEQIIEEGDRAIGSVFSTLGVKSRKPRVREGEGPTALKCKEWARKALEDEVGKPVTITALWNQQGSYRGPRWDLDRWGLFFTVEGSNLKGTASSLATMTECQKAGGIKASCRGSSYEFNLDPI